MLRDGRQPPGGGNSICVARDSRLTGAAKAGNLPALPADEVPGLVGYLAARPRDLRARWWAP